MAWFGHRAANFQIVFPYDGTTGGRLHSLTCGSGSQSGILPLSAYGGRGMCAGTSSIGDTLPGRSGERSSSLHGEAGQVAGSIDVGGREQAAGGGGGGSGGRLSPAAPLTAPSVPH